MKNVIFILLLGVISIMSMKNSYASTPCDTLVCMAGKAGVGDPGGSSCNGPINHFFNIIEKDHDGVFDAGATADARKSFLMGCSGASENMDVINTIIQQFGRLQFL